MNKRMTREAIMKKTIISGVALLALAACSQEPKQANLQNENAKASYAMGMDVGSSLARIGAADQVDSAAFMEGFKTSLAGGEARLTLEEAYKIKQVFFKNLYEAQAIENKKAGEAFLAANKKREEVKTTKSGLQYEVITPAEGKKPSANAVVTVHYRGTFIDGREFNNTYTGGEPATFPLSNLIEGWAEGLQLMSVGSKYRFYIPSDLAYGPQGKSPIGPNATLIFEVELLAISEPETKKQPSEEQPAAK